MLAGPKVPEAQHPMPAHAGPGPWGGILALKTCVKSLLMVLKKFTWTSPIFIGYHAYTGWLGHSLGDPD
jgi:hypothetical protein